MFPSPTDLGSHKPPTLGPNVLAGTLPVSGSDTIYNSSSPPLVDIVLFGLSPRGFKTRLLRRGFHTLIRNVSFPSPTNVGYHNPPPLRAQRPSWQIAQCLALIPFIIAQAHPLSSLGFPFRASPQDFKTHLLGRGFHTSIRNVSFPPPINVGSHK